MINADEQKLENCKDQLVNKDVDEEHISSNVTATCPEQCTSTSGHDDSNLSTCSDWFNTTREEMILYERFGENYDIIVEKMCKEEKVKLKEEVSKATPKDAMELLEKSQSNSGDTLKVQF